MDRERALKLLKSGNADQINAFNYERGEQHLELSNADLTEARLSIEAPDGSRVSANLKNCDLSAAKLDGAALDAVVLQGARLENASLRAASLHRANLDFAKLNRAVLTRARLTHARMASANLSEADLVGANLGGAYLERANLHGTDLRCAVLEECILTGAQVRGAKLAGARGLFGRARARMEGVVDGEWAIFASHCDWLDWSRLRFIGSLRLFGASYLAFIAIAAYANAVEWLNGHIRKVHDWAHSGQTDLSDEVAGLLLRLPELPVARHFGFLLVALASLAFGATLYALRCPDPIKEGTEVRWTRELGQPVVEYRAAMYDQRVVRYVCGCNFLVGGLYTLGYLIWRGWLAVMYLLVA